MFGQAPETELDLRFSLLRIPVRVHPVFWITSLVLAWVPGELGRTLVRLAAIFLAILVHELGHAVATRHFGWRPEIVLYFLGGYTTVARHSTWKDIAVLAAGPAAGFLLFVVFAFAVPWLYIGVQPHLPDWWFPAGHQLLEDFVWFSVFINLVWNVLNLVPVLPLDGGQICRELCLWLRPRDGLEICLKVSMVAAGAIAVIGLYAYGQKQAVLGLNSLFLGVMFGFLCYQSYQDYQRVRGGYW